MMENIIILSSSKKKTKIKIIPSLTYTYILHLLHGMNFIIKHDDNNNQHYQPTFFLFYLMILTCYFYFIFFIPQGIVHQNIS